MRTIVSFNQKVPLLLLLMLCFCGNALAQEPDSSASATPSAKTDIVEDVEFKTIEWTDLMPQADLDALLNPPEYIAEIEDGSFEDQISSQLQSDTTAAENDRYQQALVSTTVKPEMNGRSIRIPGYIVPLEFGGEMTITEFFMVPFFGACIHVPPPPPNQIIHVRYPRGFKLESLYQPFWASGVLKTSLIENDMATAAYALEVAVLEPYLVD